MFSEIKRVIGAISVEEKGNLITVEGLPANVFFTDIYKYWGTSKIEQWMFTTIGRSKVSFNKFFALDVLYTLKTLHAKHKHKHNYRAVEKIIELLYKNTHLGKHVDENIPDILDFTGVECLNLRPLAHQMEFLQIYNRSVPRYNLSGYLLAGAPGSGKTLTALYLAECLHKEVKVIICPKKALNDPWEVTLKTRYKTPRTFWSSGSGTPPPDNVEFYIVHYDYLEHFTKFAKESKLNKHLDNCFVVLDECHNFNDLTSLRSQLFVQFCKDRKTMHVLPMSGTPIKAVGSEAATILSVIAPDFNEDAQTRFLKIFGRSAERANDILCNRLGLLTFKVDSPIQAPAERIIPVQIPHGEKYTLDNVREEMRRFIDERAMYYRANMNHYVNLYLSCLELYFRTLKTEEQKRDFIKYRRYADTIRNGYDPTTMKEYVTFCNQFELKHIMPSLERSLAKEFKAARSVYKYVALKIMGEALGRVLSKIRTQCHVDMINYVDLASIVEGATKKTILFTSFVEVVDKVFDTLTEQGFKPLRVYGDTNKDLKSIIAKFADDPDANPLVATYQSLSEAVPLVMANTLVMLNAPFRDWERKQAIARVARLGQDTETDIIQILLDTGAKANISTRSKDIMEWSKRQAEEILGFKTDDPEVTLEDYEVKLNDPETLDKFFTYMMPGDVAEEVVESIQPAVKPMFLSW